MPTVASDDAPEMGLRLVLPDRFRQVRDVSGAEVEDVMEPHPLETLTPSERNVLRVLLQERDQKTIARQLNLSPETVKTHLRNAREKTGMRQSFALARALAEHETEREADTPERGITPRGGGFSSSESIRNETSKRPEEQAPDDDAFHEKRAVFDHDRSSSGFLVLREEKQRNHLSAVTRMLIATSLGILLVVMIILAFPLSESFQRLADVLDPP